MFRRQAGRGVDTCRTGRSPGEAGPLRNRSVDAIAAGGMGGQRIRSRREDHRAWRDGDRGEGYPEGFALGLDRAAGAGDRGRQPGRRRTGVVGRPGGADRGRGIARAGGSPVESRPRHQPAAGCAPRRAVGTCRASRPPRARICSRSCGSVRSPQPALIRSQGAGIIERAALTREQLTEVTKWVVTAGPLELPRLLRAFDADGDETLGLTLLAALERASSRSSLRPDVLKPRLAKYPPAVQARADALLATVNLDGGAGAAARRACRRGSGRRRPARSAGVQQREDRLPDLSRDRLRRRQGRAGSDANRAGADRPRSAGGRRCIRARASCAATSR